MSMTKKTQFPELKDRGQCWAQVQVPTTDEQGRFEEVSLEVTKEEYREIEKLILSDTNPFQTIGEFMRWSIDRGQLYLGTP